MLERGPEPMFTPEQVAARLHIKPRTVVTWLQQGRMRGVKLGRLWRIAPSAVEEFLRSAAQEASRADEAGVDEEMAAWEAADLAPPLEPYDWGGVDPLTLGEPVEYVPGVGLRIGESK